MFVTPHAHKRLCWCVSANTIPVMPHIVLHLLPGPASAGHQFTNCTPTEPSQSLSVPGCQFPTHSIHSITADQLQPPPRAPHQPPALISTLFPGTGQDGCSEERCCIAGRLQESQLGECWRVTFWLQQHMKGCYHWWGANEVLWRRDNCCQVSSCSPALPASLGWVVGETMAIPFRHTGGPCPWFWWALGKPFSSRVLPLSHEVCCRW